MFEEGQKGNIADYERLHLIDELKISYKIQILESFYREKQLIADYFSLLHFMREDFMVWWKENVLPCICKKHKTQEELWKEYIKEATKYIDGHIARDLTLEDEINFTKLVPFSFRKKHKQFLKAKQKLKDLACLLKERE